MNNKDKITEVTFLLSLEKGFDNVSMKEIQEASGLSAGSIYYYFKDKNDILISLLNKYFVNNIPLLKEAIISSNASFMEKLTIAFIGTTTSFNKERIHGNSSILPEFNYEDYFVLMMSVYHQYPEVRHIYHEVRNDLNNFYQELIQEAVENGEISDDVDTKALSIFIQSCLKGHITLWLNQSDFSLEEIVGANLRMIKEIIEPTNIIGCEYSPLSNSIKLE